MTHNCFSVPNAYKIKTVTDNNQVKHNSLSKALSHLFFVPDF